MSPATSKLCLIDPLTLRGRELLQLLPEMSTLAGDLHYLHTDDDEEHQIAELDGKPGLVYPLDSTDELEGCSTIVVCSDADSPRLDALEQYLAIAPETVLVDLSRLERLWDLTRPAVGGLAQRPSPPHLRVAHPSLVAARCLLDRISQYETLGTAITAVDPASSRGRQSIEMLAHQATERLQGQEVSERIDGSILAFNLVAHLGDRLTEEASEILSTPSVAFSLIQSGCFHGHLAQISVVFGEPVDDREVLEIWEMDPRIELLDTPLGLESVVNNLKVVVAPPSFSSDRRTLCVTAMVDGLLLGGAQTALEIIQGVM